MQHSDFRILKTGKRLKCGSTSDILGSSLGRDLTSLSELGHRLSDVWEQDRKSDYGEH